MSPTHMRGAATRRHTLLLLTVVATLIAFAPAARAQASTGGGAVRARCADCATTLRDSVRARREQLLVKFDSLRYHFEHVRLSQAERELLSDEMRRTMIALQQALGDAVRANALEASKRDMRAEAFPFMPDVAVEVHTAYRTRGYLGVSFDGPWIEIPRRNERVIRYLDYPRIALVEPSSPAERAGIQQGDTLLAFNGNDVRDRETSLTKLLVPEQRVTVRVRRDGNPRDFRVTVAEAPVYVISRAAPMPPMPPAAVVTPTPPLPARVRVYSGDDYPRRTPMPTVVPGPGGAGVGTTWIYSNGVAGAQVETITEGLGRAVGAKSGVLVIRAEPGTPAYRSGLRDGDVILRGAGRSLSTVRELRRMLADGDGEAGVKLVIRRDRKERDVTLRW